MLLLPCWFAVEAGGKEAATPPCVDPASPSMLPRSPVLLDGPVPLPATPLLLGNGALGVAAVDDPRELVLL